MLDGIENSIDSGVETGFHKTAGRLGNGRESLQHSFGIQTQVRDQRIAACEVLCLRQRTEDRLEQGSIGAELGADETETVQLFREMRSGGVEDRQRFPVTRIMDEALRVLTCPF